MCFGSIHSVVKYMWIETFESIKDAYEGMHSENIEELNSLATTKSCIFNVYGPRK